MADRGSHLQSVIKRSESAARASKRQKTAWIIAMLIIAATLSLIISNRLGLDETVIFGGSETGFLTVGRLSDPFYGYSDTADAKAEKDAELNFPEDIEISEWMFILANNDNSIERFTPTVINVGDTETQVDERISDALLQLVAEAQEAGFTPYLGDGYISYVEQDYLFTGKVSQLMWDGSVSKGKAEHLARKEVFYPGASDHQTGLGVNIFDKRYTGNDYSGMSEEFYKWLDANCADFGFIKRYPENKSDITGWSEPWHYRYVGKTAAAFIMNNGLTLEEFIAHYK